MGTAAAIGLIALSAFQGAISLYFATLLYRLPTWLGRALGGAAGACGIDGGSCKRVVRTPYARLLGGQPNVLAGLAWAALVIVCAAIYLSTGRFPLWRTCVAISWASIAVAVYLTWVLLRKLHDPCPL